jgi:hypothetical protein
MAKNVKIGKFSLFLAIVGLIVLAAYTVYGIVYEYFDSVVFGALVAGVMMNLFASFSGGRIKFFNLLAVLANCVALAFFFLNSFYVWADNVNDLDMYGSRGGLEPVVAIMVAVLFDILLGIIVCFTKDKKIKIAKKEENTHEE